MIIISNKPGQLGNMLFVFGHFIALGKEKHIKVLNPAFHEYKKYFENYYEYLLPGYPQSHIRFSSVAFGKIVYTLSFYIARILHRLHIRNKTFSFIHLEWEQEFNLVENSSLLVSQWCFVQGWQFRSVPFFWKDRAYIRNFFKLKAEYQVLLDQIIKNARKTGRILVGIHIRQGDYRSFEGGRYFYTTVQYVEIMNRLNNFFKETGNPAVTFLIVSNNLNIQNEVRDLQVSELDISWGMGQEVVDMYSLASCDYAIGPPSTFLQWACYYGNVPACLLYDSNMTFHASQFKVPEQD
jgi:hypothetical protein